MKKESKKSTTRKLTTKASRKKTIRDLSQETETILAAMGDAVSIQDIDFKILYQNKIHIGIIGDHKSEYCYRAYENRDHICEGCPVAMTFKDGKIHTEERSITRGNESSYFEITASPLRDSKKEIIAGIEICRDITERKRIEGQIREGERFMASIFTSIQDGMGIVDRDMNIIRVNPTTEKWYSHNMPLVGKKCYEAYHKRNEPCKVCPTRKTLETGESSYGVVRKTGPEGRDIGWLEIYSFPMIDTETGLMNGAIEYVRDITARKHAEEEKDRLLKAIDSSTEGITIADEKDRYIYVNAAYAMIFGYAQEELIGNTWHMITPTEMIAPTEKGLSCTMHNRDIGVFNGEVPGFRKDGTIIPTEVKGTGFWDETGNYQGHVCIVRDITERKRAEEELNIKALLLDRATDSIFVHDLEGKFVYINESAYKSRGYSKEEMMNMNLNNLVTPEYGKLINKQTRVLLEKGEHVFESADICKNNSIIPLEVHSCIIKSGGKKLILSVARDITERKQAEKLLKEKARAELYGFIVSALPVFASNVPSQVRNTLVRNFAERFEKNVRPRFEEEIKGREIKNISNEYAGEMLYIFISWLSGLLSNLGIQNKTTSEVFKGYLEFFNCPWKGEANINPIYCFMCRTIVIRSFTWTGLKGNADQKSSIANGSETCMFEIHVKSK